MVIEEEPVSLTIRVVYEADDRKGNGRGAVRGTEVGPMSALVMDVEQGRTDDYPNNRRIGTSLPSAIDRIGVTMLIKFV